MGQPPLYPVGQLRTRQHGEIKTELLYLLHNSLDPNRNAHPSYAFAGINLSRSKVACSARVLSRILVLTLLPISAPSTLHLLLAWSPLQSSQCISLSTTLQAVGSEATMTPILHCCNGARAAVHKNVVRSRTAFDVVYSKHGKYRIETGHPSCDLSIKQRSSGAKMVTAACWGHWAVPGRSLGEGDIVEVHNGVTKACASWWRGVRPCIRHGGPTQHSGYCRAELCLVPAQYRLVLNWRQCWHIALQPSISSNPKSVFWHFA